MKDVTSSNRFSMTEAKSLVKDLMQPRPVLYWCDFLLTIVLGHLLFALEIRASDWLHLPNPGFWGIRLTMFTAVAILYMRASMFIHELVHLRRDTFQGFRFIWNMLCGIPFLIPSFMYYPHIDHHRRKSYGTHEDGEYVELSHKRPVAIIAFVMSALVVPPAAFFRFLILTPIAWCWPDVREWVEKHASSMVVNLFYLRVDFGPRARRTMLMQEALCFAWCVFLVVRGPIRDGVWLTPFWLHAYAISVALVGLNNLRTLGAHRWVSHGRESTFEEQLLDSLNYPHRPWFTELWGPVGVRYHALHHLFPSLPYHNLGVAHRRLRAGLPVDSLYHLTERTSLIQAILELWQRSAANRRLPSSRDETSLRLDERPRSGSCDSEHFSAVRAA